MGYGNFALNERTTMSVFGYEVKDICHFFTIDMSEEAEADPWDIQQRHDDIVDCIRDVIGDKRPAYSERTITESSMERDFRVRIIAEPGRMGSGAQIVAQANGVTIWRVPWAHSDNVLLVVDDAAWERIWSYTFGYEDEVPAQPSNKEVMEAGLARVMCVGRMIESELQGWDGLSLRSRTSTWTSSSVATPDDVPRVPWDMWGVRQLDWVPGQKNMIKRCVRWARSMLKEGKLKRVDIGGITIDGVSYPSMYELQTPSGYVVAEVVECRDGGSSPHRWMTRMP